MILFNGRKSTQKHSCPLFFLTRCCLAIHKLVDGQRTPFWSIFATTCSICLFCCGDFLQTCILIGLAFVVFISWYMGVKIVELAIVEGNNFIKSCKRVWTSWVLCCKEKWSVTICVQRCWTLGVIICNGWGIWTSGSKVLVLKFKLDLTLRIQTHPIVKGSNYHSKTYTRLEYASDVSPSATCSSVFWKGTQSSWIMSRNLSILELLLSLLQFPTILVEMAIIFILKKFWANFDYLEQVKISCFVFENFGFWISMSIGAVVSILGFDLLSPT